MTELGFAWLQFAICAALIGFAGPRLSLNGDILAEKTGLSGSWIGLILIATVTSIPELIGGISAVTIANVPDIAVGNLLGACVFNLAILIVIDLLHRDEPMFRRAHLGHILSAAFGIMLIGWAGMNVLLYRGGDFPSLGPAGVYTPIMMGLYLIGVRTVFRYESRQRQEFVEEVAARYPDVTFRQAVRRFTLASVVLVAAGVSLPFAAAHVAEAMGWKQAFVATMFVAATTSMPELIVTIAAVRLKALNMAIANLLGSNMFVIFILAIDDLAYVKGPLLADVSPTHAVSAFSAVIMTSIVVVGLLYKSTTRAFRYVDWISIILFLLYLLNCYVLYVFGH